MKVIRILVYDGCEDWMLTQLNRSLPDGEKKVTGGSITAITINTLFMTKLSDVIEDIKEGIGVRF